MFERTSDDQRPVTRVRRWLRVYKLMLTAIVMTIGVLETLGLL